MNYKDTIKRPCKWISDDEVEKNIQKAQTATGMDILQMEMEAVGFHRYNRPHRKLLRYIKRLLSL